MKYLQLLILLPFQLAVWVAAFVIEVIFTIPGFAIVPLLWKYRYTHIDMMPIWSIPWVNPEDWHGGALNYDGSVPPWYIKKMGKDDFWTFYRYHAFRNAANGLRSMGLSVKVIPEKSHYITPEYHRHYEYWAAWEPKFKFYYAWRGIFSGMKLMYRWNEEKYSEIKLGWRFGPGDIEEGLSENSVRRELGAAFAKNFRLWRNAR